LLTAQASPAKRAAAEKAAEIVAEAVESGSVSRLGVGTGSTTRLALQLLAERLGVERLGRLRLYASSLDTLLAIRGMGLEAYTAIPRGGLDLYFDGADEVAVEAGSCMILKGRGAAMTREKLLAYNSRRVIIVVDETKLSRSLGEKGRPLPVEVLPAAVEAVVWALEARGVPARPRGGCGCRDGPAVTDNCGVVVDVEPWGRMDVFEVEAFLETMPGVVEHGLFIGYADEVVVGRRDGSAGVVECRRTRVNPGLRRGWPS